MAQEDENSSGDFLSSLGFGNTFPRARPITPVGYGYGGLVQLDRHTPFNVELLWVRVPYPLPFIMKTNEKTQEQIERERVEYALENQWVLKYNFGHWELIKKYYNMMSKI